MNELNESLPDPGAIEAVDEPTDPFVEPAAEPAASKSPIADQVAVKLMFGDMTPVGLDAQVEVLVTGRRIAYMLVREGARFCWLPRNHLKKGKIVIDFTIEEKIAIVARARQLCAPIRDRLIREAETLARLEKGIV